MNTPRLYLAVLLAVVLTACATTTMHTVESDPSFHSGQLRKVLVLNMGTNGSLRERVEDEFVRQWRKRGVDAHASHSVLAPGVILDKAHVAAAAREQKFDAVLVTRLVGSQKLDPDIRGDDFEVAISTGLTAGTTVYEKAVVASPEYAGDYRMAAVTSRLFDAATEKRVWSGTSQTLVAKDVSKLIKPFVATVLDSLYQTP